MNECNHEWMMRAENASGGDVGEGNYLGTLYATCLCCGAKAYQDCFLDRETAAEVA
jgi:hypothetical protein